MYRRVAQGLLVGIALAAIAAAPGCGSSDDSARRTVAITQTDSGCLPGTIDATPGEQLRFEVHNEGKRDAEIEGIEGTKLEELLIPSGKTRGINYTAPKQPGTGKIKCYVPAGQSTIIHLNVHS
jgi:hypothetical protein